MSNISTQENQGVLGNLVGVIGKVAFFPIEAIKFGAVTALNLITYVGITSINLANNVLKGVSSVLDGVQTGIASKK
ncbi:MAG: hypothetical protein WCI90_08450 [Chlorobium sp.]|nr:MAG: hypothetical protein FDX17_07515 [Chlorobium sp.]